MKYLIVIKKVVFCFLFILFIVGSVAAQHTFYASPNGSGTECSQSSPGSLSSVRDKVRTVNSNMTGDIVVNINWG